ncbi:MAG: DUF1015 domain-containing protein [Candidatus Thermoplasmatota archaeon]|nr:DUF1015 domain-containing protein [Candidatus Thermoplasmatota archaeon]
MVEVNPFQGITYNRERIKKLDDVMSPPYDIISPKMQDELYKKSPLNFVRLILGKQNPDDGDNNNRYTRAKKIFDKWMDESVFIKSGKPAIFPYKIEYKVDGKSKKMNGFFVLLKIDPDYKQVLAHERTLSKPKADRLNLMRQCKSNLEPIQLLYIDENDVIRENIDSSIKNSIISVKGYDGFKHSLYKIEDEEVIEKIVDELKDKILFIADGHHRYQTAINYANEMKEKTGNKNRDAPFNYRMVILANIFDEGLSILPTHRLIKMKNINRKELISKLGEYFEIKENKLDGKQNTPEILAKKIIKAIKTEKAHKFAMYFKDAYYILKLKDENFMDNFAADRSKTWRTLDVSILHKIILEHIMGINETNLEDHVKYTRSDEEAISLVNDEQYEFSFLINATKIKELRAIAEAGEHMPQKSTYFLPKMLSGLVFYKME